MLCIRSVLVAGVLAAACGQGMAAPISPLSLIDLPETVLAPAQIGLMAVLVFPEVPEAVFDEILEPSTGRSAPKDLKARTERVPEPSTGLMLTIELFLAGSFWVLHRQMRKQRHRPFCRRVRRVWRMMA